MSHDVQYTNDVEAWWSGLTFREQVDVATVVELLVELGTALGSPYSSRVTGSTHLNMHQLQVPSDAQPMRVFYAIDAPGTAILLTGGREVDQNRFFLVHVHRADAIYHEHLQGIQRERRLKPVRQRRRPWRELFERLPLATRADVQKNTAKALAELDRVEHKSADEQHRDGIRAPGYGYRET